MIEVTGITYDSKVYKLEVPCDPYAKILPHYADVYWVIADYDVAHTILVEDGIFSYEDMLASAKGFERSKEQFALAVQLGLTDVLLEMLDEYKLSDDGFINYMMRQLRGRQRGFSIGKPILQRAFSDAHFQVVCATNNEFSAAYAIHDPEKMHIPFVNGMYITPHESKYIDAYNSIIMNKWQNSILLTGGDLHFKAAQLYGNRALIYHVDETIKSWKPDIDRIRQETMKSVANCLPSSWDKLSREEKLACLRDHIEHNTPLPSLFG